MKQIKPTLDELRGVLGGYGFAKVKSEDLSDATELHKEMTDHLASKFGKLLDDQDLKDSSEIAIYWFANDYHRGQADPLYSILSQSPYTPGPMMSSAADEGETVDMLYQELVDAFSNPVKPEAAEAAPVAEGTRFMSAKYVSDILGMVISDIMKGRAKWALDNLQKLKKDLETGSLEIAERK